MDSSPAILWATTTSPYPQDPEKGDLRSKWCFKFANSQKSKIDRKFFFSVVIFQWIYKQQFQGWRIFQSQVRLWRPNLGTYWKIWTSSYDIWDCDPYYYQSSLPFLSCKKNYLPRTIRFTRISISTLTTAVSTSILWGILQD